MSSRPIRRESIYGYAPRLFGYVIALIAVAVPITAGALIAVAVDPPTPATATGVAVFFALTLLAELKPVPLDVDESRLVSLAFVFIVAGGIVFGWEYSVLISAAALVLAQAVAKTRVLRNLFNAAAYAVAAAAATIPAHVIPLDVSAGDYGRLTFVSFAAGAIFVALNVGFVCAAIALHERVSIRSVVADHLRHSGPAFVIMAFLAALTVALWVTEPFLILLLAGPVFALALFQRYALRTRVAMQAASTDSLTRLPNHRSYEADLAATLATSEGDVALCLLDIDNFKRLNDTHGHPVGDRVLVRFGELLMELPEEVAAYRLGGDEFALIISGGQGFAQHAIERVRAELRDAALPEKAATTFSAGIACYPHHAAGREELVRAADAALYWTKRHGKDQTCVFDSAVVALSWSSDLAASVEYEARLRAAAGLVRAVDARDTYTGSHSQSVAVLAEAIGRALGLEETMVSRLRLAGLLHDLGKLAVPDRILQKPGRLDASEFAALREHAERGFELLHPLDVAPLDEWILHHHEHWDGTGYPHGLRGEEIPLGARIILVADAFDAITSDRCYRPAASVDHALDELRRCAGTQFDPTVVDALVRSLGDRAAIPEAVAVA